MKILKQIMRLFRRSKEPVCVKVSRGTVTYKGVTIEWDHIIQISIQTTDLGPFVEDVFWVLKTETNKVVIPQVATGADDILERAQGLPGFDNKSFLAAMCCTDNKEFICWRKKL